MKRIGLIGGMSWESSLEYYRLINEEVKDRLGGFNSADCKRSAFSPSVEGNKYRKRATAAVVI
jgi:aspartate/glutamate racemase